MACEVHLGIAPNKDSVEIFLETAKAEQESSSSSSNNSNVTCLFVWIDRNGNALIGEKLPERYDSAVAFVGAATVTTASASGEGEGDGSEDEKSDSQPVVRQQLPLQCVTLQPSFAAPIVKNNDDPEGKDDEFAVQEAPSSQATLLSALQLYTRHLFLPAISATDNASSSSSSSAEENKSGDKSSDSNNTAVLQDKIRELDVAIHQSQRSARLPSVTLGVDKIISRVIDTQDIKEGSDDVQKFSGNVDWNTLGLSSKLRDDEYLNLLQTGVSSWIGQIRKLTVLPRTTPFPMISDDGNGGGSGAGGPDLEEINFWNQLNDELRNVKNQLKSPGVELTLSMLREAKRFVATLALENNTGLESSIAYVKDIEHFLKPYPSKEFLVARDFDKIGTVLNLAFDHLPKIRQSRYYTLERTAQLLSATTLTMRRNMERILRENYSNTLLFMDYKDYESMVRYPTQDVFVQFDDRYDEFKEFFLEQGRRRNKLGGGGNEGGSGGNSNDAKIDPAKILDRLTLYQKPLEKRLDQIHEFRSGHERLRQVVLQVLKSESNDDNAVGVINNGGNGGSPEEEDSSSSTNKMNDETLGAIQTVENAPRLLFSSLDVLDLSPGGTKALESSLEAYDLRMDAVSFLFTFVFDLFISSCVQI
jgi:dynein heavy chain 1